MIVLNGEPFLLYNLRALYPYAYQIIVVEGACHGAESIATGDGHSTDGTLQTLKNFKENEDPQGKLQIVTREGFWTEKDEQSAAYAKVADGDYLWQVDVDEFYKPADMEKILTLLHQDKSITAVSFKQITFWGGLEFVADGWYLQNGANIYRRLFKWQHGFSYVTHRPPTVFDAAKRDLFSLNALPGTALAKMGIYLYHYSLLFPRQVAEKCAYYLHAKWSLQTRAQTWFRESYQQLKQPYRVHNVYTHPSWLERFHGTHPPQVEAMMQDVKNGKWQLETRDNEDVEQLLRSVNYRLGRLALKFGSRPARLMAEASPFLYQCLDRTAHPIRTLKRGVSKLLN